MKRSFRLSDSAPDPKRDVADELRFHLDMRTREFVERGMSPEEARRAALASFGDPEAVEAECRTLREERARRRAISEWRDDVTADVRYALRALRRSPGFAAAAVLTLALGIGAAAAVFTVVNGVLLRPMPYAQPDRVVMVWTTGENGAITQWPHSAANFEDMRRSAKAFEGMSAFRFWPYPMQSEDGTTELVAGARVSPALFGVLGVRPMLGRGFTEADAQTGAGRVAVLSHDLWRRRFGSDPRVLGRTIALGAERFTLVGVMPAGFAFPRGAELPAPYGFRPRTELWTPLVYSPLDLAQRGTQNLAAVARLRGGLDLPQANADLRRIAAQLRAEYPSAFAPDMGLAAVTLKEQAVAPVRRGLLLFMGAVVLVLLVACANVTNLLVARGAARAREFAVRRALGASRARLARQLVTENVVLALLGATLGLLFAAWASAAAVAVVPGELPRADDVGLDLRVALATLGVAVLAGIAFGLAGAAGAARAGSLAGLQGTRSIGGVTHRVGRRTLVAAEVALSLVLLVGAGLLGVSFARLQGVDSGFRPDGVMTAGLLMPMVGGFNPARDGARWSRQHTEYSERLQRLPNVAAAGGVSSLPLSGAIEFTSFRLPDRPAPAPGERPGAAYSVVTPGYFAAGGIELLDGRTFDSRDHVDGSRVVIVSEGLARKHWPGERAVGKRMLFGFDAERETEVVGVARDVRLTALDAPSEPAIYLPVTQVPYPFLTYVVRGKSGPPSALLPAMRRELAAMDPTLALHEIRSLSAVVDASLARQRFGMLVAGGFAVAALLLATVGLYGVIAYGVTQRTREIGVRLALGARPGDVQRLIVGEGMRTVAVGVAVGLAGAVAAARLIGSLLYGVSATSPVVYGAVAALAVVVALAASWLPARRAAGLDPTVALRAD